MKIQNICILTNNVKGLHKFYSSLFQIKPRFASIAYVEFDIGGTILAIYNLENHNEMVEIKAESAANKSMMIEIEVENVDEEYKRVCDMGIKIVKKVSTQSWGSRSFYFLDPDNNVIDFFTRVNVDNKKQIS